MRAVEAVKENKQRYEAAEAQALMQPKSPMAGFMRSFVSSQAFGRDAARRLIMLARYLPGRRVRERVELEIGPANKLMPEGQGREPARLKSWVYPPSVPLGAGLRRAGSLKSGGGSPRSMQVQVLHCWH